MTTIRSSINGSSINWTDVAGSEQFVAVKATEGIPEEEALKMELEFGWPIFATEDAKEGQKAFAEKRKPDWQNK